MLISTDWIKDFVDLPSDLSAEELGSKVTLSTAEVEEVLEHNKFWSQMFVAQIKSFEKHPEADKLNIVTFSIGSEERKVVCGAANVKNDLKVCYAPTGVTLPIGFTLEPKKIRGVLSEGMLCSKEELGLEDSSEGIWELPEDAPVGKSMAEYLQKKVDILIDIDNKSLTHRPDLWGHFGFAREFSAIWDNQLKNPYDKNWAIELENKLSSEPSPIIPTVAENSCGLLYLGLSIDGVEVKQSPAWMQDRLHAVGLRPINSIVDISNYVMAELGIPNHIFDRDSIKDNKILIHPLEQKQKFITLDEIERELIAGDTVISDSEKPLVIGGIMGGLSSGVTDKTTKVFVEVANWKAAEVRRTSTRLGLRTDSSQRYEKSLDSQLCYRTMLRILELITLLNPHAKVIGGIEKAGPDVQSKEPLKIKTSIENIIKLLGKEISKKEILRIFSALDFQVEDQNDGLLVTIPSYRATKDIEYEADLIEEIGRMVGYDNIEPRSPDWTISPVSLSPTKKLHRKIQDFLVQRGRCLEVMTYPLVGEKLLEKAQWQQKNESLRLVNSLSEDHDRMRPSLISGLLESSALNSKHQQRFSLFELGKVYTNNSKSFSEEGHHVAIVFHDKKENRFLELLNTTEDLLETMGLKYDFANPSEKFPNPLISSQWEGLHPHEVLHIRIRGKFHGVVFTLHPLLARSYKIKGQLHMAILNLSSFEMQKLERKVKYMPLPKFPKAQFDCTVVTDIDEPVENVLQPLKKLKMKELVDVKLVGTFKLSDTQKSVTLRSFFFDPTQTLPGDVIKSGEDKIVQVLENAGFHLKT